MHPSPSPLSLLLRLFAALLIAGLPFLLGDARAATASAKPPNFLVVLVEGMGFSDAGCYGGEFQTPYLDYLASRGLRFTQAYHPSGPDCAEGVLLTGFYPQHGLMPPENRDNPGSGSSAVHARPAWLRLLPSLLQAAGYRSYYSGVWSLGGMSGEADFEGYFDYGAANKAGQGDSVPDRVAERACEFLQDHKARAAGKPFFSFVRLPRAPEKRPAATTADQRGGIFEGGREAISRLRLERLWTMGMLLNAELPNVASSISGGDPVARPEAQNAEFQRRMELQADHVSWVDAQMGRLLEQVKALGWWENTVVCFLSEPSAGPPPPPEPWYSRIPVHAPLRESDCGLHEGGIATPLVVHWPAGIRARGETREQFVHVVDLAPTLLKIAGVAWPKKLGSLTVPGSDGVDLTPVLRENKIPASRPLWWFHAGSRAFRLGDWKWLSPRGKPVELYYLKEDRSEMRDVAEVNYERVKEMEVQWTRMAGRFQADSEGPGAKTNGH